jgi:hypothetical protein
MAQRYAKLTKKRWYKKNLTTYCYSKARSNIIIGTGFVFFISVKKIKV